MPGFPTISRRSFCATAAATTAAAALRGPAWLEAQSTHGSATHPDVAGLDHDRILAEAAPYLAAAPTPLTGMHAPRSPGTPNDFYSEPEDYLPDPTSPTAPWKPSKESAKESADTAPAPAAFTAHRDAVYSLSVQVATLTAAFVLTNDARYSQKAAEHLRAWFVTPATRMQPSLDFGQHIPNDS